MAREREVPEVMAPSSISRSRKAVLRARWSETVMPSVVAMAMREEFMRAYGNSWRGLAVFAPPKKPPERRLRAKLPAPQRRRLANDQRSVETIHSAPSALQLAIQRPREVAVISTINTRKPARAISW